MSNKLEYKNRKVTAELQKGCPNAFRKIFEQHHQKLLVYCVAIVKQNSVAADIVQETFIRLWENRTTINPDKSVSGYIHTIARNLAFNHLKSVGYDHELKKRIWRIIQKNQQRVDFEDDMIERESRKVVQRAIDLLPPQRQRIYLLSREKGMTHKEIGLKLGISKNTVKNQIVSALKEVKAHLRKHADIALLWLMTVFHL